VLFNDYMPFICNWLQIYCFLGGKPTKAEKIDRSFLPLSAKMR
jgi:hypothetical protein